jgi:hypothetical protein
VNGHDLAAELTDDELAAAVPPHLRRHASSRNSTPGAFLVRGSGVVSLAPTAAMTCDTDAENGMGHPPTLIAATLVDPMASYSSVEGVDNYHKASPTLVFAEPLWWKRRLVLCISGWMLLALGVVTLAVTLAIQFTENHRTGNKSTNDSSTPTTPSLVNTSVPTVSPVEVNFSSAPTFSPVTLPSLTYAPDSTVAYHAVSWGMVSTCEEENSTIYNKDLSISCGGGVLEIHNTTAGVGCEVNLDFNGKAACRMNQTTEDWNTVLGGNSTQASGLVLFSCRGAVDQERTATVELPEAPVMANCSTSTIDPLSSNFVSLGRFCFEDPNWKLRQELYQCEKGEPYYIKSSNRRSLLPTFSWDELIAGLEDVIRSGVEFLNITSFCYNELNCTSATQESCAVARTVMSDIDYKCVLSGGELPPIDSLWDVAQTALEPSKRIDALISGPVGG